VRECQMVALGFQLESHNATLPSPLTNIYRAAPLHYEQFRFFLRFWRVPLTPDSSHSPDLQRHLLRLQYYDSALPTQ